jgi:hypothetical protein
MLDIDDQLKRYFYCFPFSFSAVVKEIEAHESCQGNLMSYVSYLLDDSMVPPRVRETLKPDLIESPTSWDAIAAYNKLQFFRKGASDCSKYPSLLSEYQEKNFTRHTELDVDLDQDVEHYSAIRKLLKDDIIKELVRAYFEGVAAGQEACLRGKSLGEDINLSVSIVDEYKRNGCINSRVKNRLFGSDEQQEIITFFMIVTDRDALIADFCIKSFSLLRDLKFKLVVYCNWMTSLNREKYLEKWRKSYPFVEIVKPEWMVEENRPRASCYGYGLQGPYERPEVPWDRELPKYKTKYYATIDADFEVLNPEFLYVMLANLEKSSAAGWLGTDETIDRAYTGYEYEGKNIIHSRIDTWCAIYRRETLACKVSHLYYEEKSLEENVNIDLWDCAALKQLALRYIHGYQGICLSRHYQHHFIHYAAFSKNRHIGETNVELYRYLMVLRKIGHEQLLDARVYSEHKLRVQDLLRQLKADFANTESVSQLATRAYYRIFSHVDNSNPYKKKM